jgi:hypothetical protein
MALVGAARLVPSEVFGLVGRQRRHGAGRAVQLREDSEATRVSKTVVS